MKHYKKLKIEYGLAPYSFSWSSNSSCLKFSPTYPTSGVTNSLVETILEVSNEVCYGSATATLNVIDANNCKNTYNITPTNPCNTFVQPTVNYNGILKNIYNFNATPNGGSAPYTYNWDYASNLFELVGSSTNQSLQLKLVNNANIIYGTAYPVTVTVTDANECVRKTTYNYTFCRPTAIGTSILASCSTNPFGVCGQTTGFANTFIDFNSLVTGCTNTSIDWNSLYIGTDDNIQGINLVSNVNGLATFCLDLALIDSSYSLALNNNVITLNYTVKDSNNNESNVGNIFLVIPQCDNVSITCITTLPTTNTIACSPTLPYVITQPLEGITPIVIPGSSLIDWNTFTFIASTGQTLTNSKLLTLSYGTISLNTNHEIIITINSIPAGKTAEVIKWKVCDENNCCSQTVSDVLILQCNTPPVATNDSYCVPCGVTTPLNITVNDTGNISSGSYLIITQSPVNGQVNINGLSLNYLANTNYFGTDIIKYILVDDNGLASNEATITIDVSCPGNPSNTVIC